jgi:hypothetical protein
MAEIEAHESKIYSEFAPLYDKIFGKIFYSRLERVIEDLEIPPALLSRLIPLTAKLSESISPPTCWPGPGKRSRIMDGPILE